MEIMKKLMDLVFPPGKECPLCGAETARDNLCRHCRAKMTDRRGFLSCRLCGRFYTEQADEAAGSLCEECRSELPAFFPARSLGPYTGELKEAIYLFKYRGRRSLADGFGQLMAGLFLDHPIFACADVLVPVPLNREKILLRGFNQSAMLAENMGRILNLPVNACLDRIINTTSQSRLTGRVRRENVKGAFVPKTAPGRVNVILVDDILTTGATAGECARVLLEAGANSVGVLTLAAGVREKSVLSS